MNSINSFIIGFCGSCVLLGFLYMLCPTGNMSIPVRYIFCLCFLCSVIGAAISIPSPDFSEFDKSKSTEVLTEQNVSATA